MNDDGGHNEKHQRCKTQDGTAPEEIIAALSPDGTIAVREDLFHELSNKAQTPVANDKGLLAMDESNPTCNKRFAAKDIPQAEGARRTWRELTITTPQLCEGISGVILYDETINQRTKDGTPFC